MPALLKSRLPLMPHPPQGVNAPPLRSYPTPPLQQNHRTGLVRQQDRSENLSHETNTTSQNATVTQKITTSQTKTSRIFTKFQASTNCVVLRKSAYIAHYLGLKILFFSPSEKRTAAAYYYVVIVRCQTFHTISEQLYFVSRTHHSAQQNGRIWSNRLPGKTQLWCFYCVSRRFDRLLFVVPNQFIEESFVHLVWRDFVSYFCRHTAS